jgi:cation diffusion facilitator CzcD-associated flavoprotein CzcO
LQTASYQLSRRRPERMKKMLRSGLEKHLPADYDIDTHFTPRYNPWDQRLCLVPDGDLFAALSEGRASIVTNTIEEFTERGVRLTSGEELEADIIITATGLNLLMLGGMRLGVDGEDVAVPRTLVYKGIMLSGVPNFALAIGYTNASWTLKVDLTYDYLWRLFRFLRDRGYRSCVPERNGLALTERPFLDFAAGYVLRSLDQLPKQGPTPWRLRMNYFLDLMTLRFGRIDDGTLRFSTARPDTSERPGSDPGRSLPAVTA